MKGKTYKIMLNKWDVELCAKTLNVSRRRVERYLNTLMKSAIRDHKSLRMFWSDVIMLNLITNKLLKTADPQSIEKILSPVEDKERRDDGGMTDELFDAQHGQRHFCDRKES